MTKFSFDQTAFDQRKKNGGNLVRIFVILTVNGTCFLTTGDRKNSYQKNKFCYDLVSFVWSGNSETLKAKMTDVCTYMAITVFFLIF